MRRRWLWILSGTLVLGIVTVLTLASRQRGPFRFLDDHNLLESHPVAGLTYCFRADYNELVKSARRELEPLGFQFHEIPADGYHFYRSAEFFRPESSGLCSVLITKDQRISANTDAEYKRAALRRRDPGWVVVRVQGRSDPSFWDRIKAVFGL